MKNNNLNDHFPENDKIQKRKQEQWKYQPSGTGGTRSPPATPHHLQHLTSCFSENLKNLKWLPGGSKLAEEVWKGV